MQDASGDGVVDHVDCTSLDSDVCLLDDEFVAGVLMLMQMLVLISVLEDEGELQEVAGAVGCPVVVEDEVVQMVLSMKKLLLKILLSKMLWVRELQVEQRHWWAEVVDEIIVLESTCFVDEVVGRPADWTLQ